MFQSSSVEIKFSEILKHTKPGVHQENIILQSLPENKLLCIVDLLQLYISRTADLKDSERRLFITTQAPFQVVARATISRWVKTVMREAGINVEQFKPHSTRAAASSAAKLKGVPLQNIMKAAGWTRESTFRRFYNKPVKEGSKFQTAVLQK